MARDPYRYFRVEARELADQLGQGVIALERAGGDGEVVSRLLRLAHTLKGAARVVRQPEIAGHAHAIEGVLSPFRELAGTMPQKDVEAVLKLIDAIGNRVSALSTPETVADAREVAIAAPSPAPGAGAGDSFRIVRTDVEEIDALLDALSEVYTEISGLDEASALVARAGNLAESLEAGATAAIGLLRDTLAQLERSIVATHERTERELRQVREAAEQLRLVLAGALFADFERTARDAAKALGKTVRFVGAGGDIRLDAHVVRIAQDAIIQLVRNGVAHGIESGAERLRAGKPAEGTIAVSVERCGRKAVFRCADDGAGIDLEALRRTAIRGGRPAAHFEGLDASGLMRLLLQGGLSTSAEITEVAGRGIGMDIVRDAVARLGAEFAVTTEPGAGSTFELIVPLTIASVEALVVEAGGMRASIPLHAVRHTLRLDPRDINRSALGETIVSGTEAIPLLPLARLLGQTGAPRRAGSQSVVIVAGRNGLAALGIDRLIGTTGIVFRALPELAPASAVIAGASLDAAGNPLLMLDPDGIIAESRDAAASIAEVDTGKRPLLVIDDSLTTRMLEQSILESAGYPVDVATSGEEGLERARRGDYALILVDVEMPGMDGFTFIEHLRRDQKLRHTPAILVTSRNAPEDKRRGHEAGAQGYVVKSEFDQGELLAHIGRLVA